VNETAAFLGAEAEWEKATIALNDIQGLWGGRAVTVTGTGGVSVEQRGPVLRSGHFTARLSESETRALLQLFVEQDFLTIAIPPRPGLPDEAHPQIALTNARGAAHAVGKWARQAEARFDALYVALNALARRLAGDT
jgi:hypothetical protein